MTRLQRRRVIPVNDQLGGSSDRDIRMKLVKHAFSTGEIRPYPTAARIRGG
jgi:hypothetical protein